MAMANTSIESPDSREDAIRLWINPETGKHNFSRCNDENLELRTVAGVKLFLAGYYKNLAVASRDLKRKSTTRDAKRKAMEDRGEVEKWFKAWREYMRYVNPENVWNVDEIGFMIGYLLKGTFLWTFAEIERPILTDAHELCSMTAIEAISAAGKSIAPFLIMPGVQLPFSQEVNEQDLPGYVTLGDTSESDFDGSDDDENAPEDDSDDQEFQEIPITPKTPEKINWATVATAPFNIRIIQRYQEYVALRIEASIVSGVRLTPSVAHVHEKSRKATEVLMINGITSTEEMKRLKEKNLRRRVLQQGTQIVSNYGPIRVSDARLRVAKDEYHRRGAQAEEYRRYRKKEATDEVKYIYRWIKDVRSIVRVSVNNVSGVEARIGLWAKAARRELLSSNEDMSKRYAIQREFRESFPLSLERITGITWPPDYDEETVTSAVKFVALEEQERRAAKKLLTYEADGIEIIVEDCIEEGRRIPWESGITVVTPLNRNRWNLNIEATLAFQRQWQAPLRIFVSEHKWKDGQPTEEEALMMLGQGDDSAIPVPAMFKFFPGMPVIVNQNTHQGLKLVNGASYTAAEVVLDKGHLGHRIDADIVLHFGPPAGILLASGTTRDFRFVGMP
ncbi:hypothetical protein ACJZ2D_016120 [Fusarium nematophilum]